MSSFAANHVHSLISSTSKDADRELSASSNGRQSLEAERLYSLTLGLKSPLDTPSLERTLEALNDYDNSFPTPPENAHADEEELVLKQLLTARILVGLYAQALDLCLKEASEADAEAQWWGDIGRSYRYVAWYLLATLPGRLKRSFDTISATLRSKGLPLRPSSFTPQSLRQLFPRSFRPTQLTTAFFPHTSQQSHLLFTSPLELAREECKLRQEQLSKLRDERAEQLGKLLVQRRTCESYIASQGDLSLAINDLRRVVTGDDIVTSPSAISLCNSLAFHDIPSHSMAHNALFSSLARPSRLTLLWPRLVLIPPAALIVFRLVYGSRQSIAETASKGYDTAKGFWFGYVIEPVKGILDTVRTGGDESARIVNREAVKADMESLERMAVALGKDKLFLNDSQIQGLSEQVRQGDLTPVLKVYEEDIKSPIRSMLTGSLVRSLLIQIQKAKVDLDQSLSGIDKLLKSQELTFAFVGVAPSITIVYAMASYLRGVWTGGRGNKKLGGHRVREGTWIAIRRVERLLVNNPGGPSNPSAKEDSTTLPPLTSGLLLIYVNHLRSYAESYLPARSLLREGFLEDVADLENPNLSRTEKLKVVERMWRSWGAVLGWHTIGKLKST